MRLDAFDYELPPERIAQRPAARRDASRLMILDSEDGAIVHAFFHQLGQRLRDGDLLVFNDSKVIRARLLGRKATGGRVELLLVERLDSERWTCLIRSSREPKQGSRLLFRAGIGARVLERDPVGWVVGFDSALGTEQLEKVGRVPLPPYIIRDAASEVAAGDAEDDERYQTVFARAPGAVAAPTALFHKGGRRRSPARPAAFYRWPFVPGFSPCEHPAFAHGGRIRVLQKRSRPGSIQ